MIFVHTDDFFGIMNANNFLLSDFKRRFQYFEILDAVTEYLGT